MTGYFNVVSDFLVLILPLPVLLRLQIPSSKKVRLLLVFGFGLFACIASVVRLVNSIQLPSEGSPTYQLHTDKEGLWASVEITIGIMVGCMPHIHKIFKHSWSQPPKIFKFRILDRTTSESSWRRLFSISSKSEASTSHRILEGDISHPHNETPKLTSHSLSSFDRLPNVPPPLSPEPKAVTRDLVSRPKFEEQLLPEKSEPLKDVIPGAENMTTRQISAPARSPWWQESVYIPENETRRARFDG
ncbi:MAG: hypothetical protein Q9195_007582 [Heterodermia aff. obscurata]